MENLSGENKSLKLEVKDLKSQFLLSEKRYEELELRLFDLEDKQDDVEQYKRKFNLEIHVYREQGDEEDNSINVMKLGHILGVKLSSEDIAHRMKIKCKDAPLPIIVHFRNYTAKKNLFKARLKLRNVDLHEIGADKLFINENLTAWRAQLFKETRNVKKISKR